MKKIVLINIMLIFIVHMGSVMVKAEKQTSDKNDISEFVDKNVRILAGKVKSDKSRDEIILEIKKIGEKASPRLKELLNSEDNERIRFESLCLLLEIKGKNDEIFEKAVSDKSYMLQVMPLLWLKIRERQDATAVEVKKWQKKLEANFDEFKFMELAKICEQTKDLYDRKGIYIGEKEKRYDAWYAAVYLIMMDMKALPLIKEELKKNIKSELWAIFDEIEKNHSEEKYGLNFLIGLLEDKIKELTNAGKTEKEIACGLAKPAWYIWLIASQYPKIFEADDIERLEKIMAPMKGRDSIVTFGTSDNLYDKIEGALDKIRAGQK